MQIITVVFDNCAEQLTPEQAGESRFYRSSHVAGRLEVSAQMKYAHSLCPRCRETYDCAFDRFVNDLSDRLSLHRAMV